MPSQIDIHAKTELPPTVYLNPGETQSLLLGDEVKLPLLVVCDYLDIRTLLFAPFNKDGQLQLFRSDERGASAAIMDQIAEVVDDGERLDIADIGLPVDEGKIILSHFNTLIGRN